MSERKHLAVRGYTNGRLIIACKCGGYQPIKGTAREQEDAHRAHRVEMGETVKPRVPTMRERLEMAISRAVELENENARLTSTDPWQRAVDGLNALVDAGIGFWIEPDGHISNPLGDEHIEYDRETERWQLVHDEEDT